MSETKVPTECNHCKSKNIIHQVWGRTEFWSCKDCKNEVVYVEPKSKYQYSLEGIDWGTWDPKFYGFGSNDYKIKLPNGITIDYGAETDENKYFKDMLDGISKYYKP